jgi:positive regulator of sigma E activity
MDEDSASTTHEVQTDAESSKIQKDLPWGTYIELRTQARHAETLRANVINYLLLITSVLLTVITLDKEVKRNDLVLCLVVVFIAVLALLFSASYTTQFGINRRRAQIARDELDRRFFLDQQLNLDAIKSEGEKEWKKKFKSLAWLSRAVGTSHVFWFLLPLLVLIVGVVLTILAASGEVWTL